MSVPGFRHSKLDSGKMLLHDQELPISTSAHWIIAASNKITGNFWFLKTTFCFCNSCDSLVRTYFVIIFTIVQYPVHFTKDHASLCNKERLDEAKRSRFAGIIARFLWLQWSQRYGWPSVSFHCYICTSLSFWTKWGVGMHISTCSCGIASFISWPLSCW